MSASSPRRSSAKPLLATTEQGCFTTRRWSILASNFACTSRQLRLPEPYSLMRTGHSSWMAQQMVPIPSGINTLLIMCLAVAIQQQSQSAQLMPVQQMAVLAQARGLEAGDWRQSAQLMPVQQMAVLAQARGLEAGDWRQPVILRLLRGVLAHLSGLVPVGGREEAAGWPLQSL